MPKDILLVESRPVQKFIAGVGADVKKYFGQDKGCVISLGDDGFFYGAGIHQWLLKQGKDVTSVDMQDNGNGLEEEKVKGRKVLIVDNDIVTGKGYKRAMETMRQKKEALGIKDIKFAALCDRAGLADFAVESYSAYAPWSLEKLDAIDLKIIQELSRDGRKSFIDIAKKTGFSQVAIKNRLEKLLADNFLKIQGSLNIGKCYSVSAHIEIEADKETVAKLIERFEKSPLVYHLVRTWGKYNLLVGVLAPNLESIENFIDREVRKDSSIKHLEISIGDLPTTPKTCVPVV